MVVNFVQFIVLVFFQGIFIGFKSDCFVQILFVIFFLVGLIFRVVQLLFFVIRFEQNNVGVIFVVLCDVIQVVKEVVVNVMVQMENNVYV